MERNARDRIVQYTTDACTSLIWDQLRALAFPKRHTIPTGKAPCRPRKVETFQYRLASNKGFLKTPCHPLGLAAGEVAKSGIRQRDQNRELSTSTGTLSWVFLGPGGESLRRHVQARTPGYGICWVSVLAQNNFQQRDGSLLFTGHTARCILNREGKSLVAERHPDCPRHTLLAPCRRNRTQSQH